MDGSESPTSDSRAERRSVPASPIVSNKTLVIAGCVGGFTGVSIAFLGQAGVFPPFCLGMGIGLTFLVIISVFIIFIVSNLRQAAESDPLTIISPPEDEVPPTPESLSPRDASSPEDLSLSQPLLSESDKTEPPSSPGSGPDAIAVVDPLSESDSGIAKTNPSTDCSANLDVTSITSGSKGKDSDEDISDPIKPIKVEVSSEEIRMVDSAGEMAAKDPNVGCTSHSTEAVASAADGQSGSSPGAEGTAI